MNFKSIYLALIYSLLSASALAFSPNTRAVLDFQSSQVPQKAASEEEQPQYRPLILKIDDESVIDELLALGTIIYHSRADLLLTSVPKENVAFLEDIDGIISIEAAIAANSCLNIARPAGLVNCVQEGIELPQAYDGTGVIAGFSDIGFDPHHLAFGDRVVLLTDYDTSLGLHVMAADAQSISNWTTDDPDKWHATHVANIMAGGYKKNAYYGVATGADIAGGTSQLNDVGILSTIEDIIVLSKSTGRPAVINLSLSSQLGPRDGTDLMCQYLSLCAQDAIICLSAGNCGKKAVSAQHTFSETKPITRCTVNTLQGYNGFNVAGMTNFWSRDDRPFQLRVEVYDNDTQTIVFESYWTQMEDEVEMSVNPEQYPEWGNYMDGSINAYAGWDPLNGRYCITVVYDTKTDIKSGNGDWSRYYTSLAITSEDGVSVNVNSDGSLSFLGHVSGGLPTMYPSSDQSISNLCCAEGVIAVGAYSTRNTAPRIGGGEFTWNFDLDVPAGFTSYGNTWQGEDLPHISAPGNYVVSAISHYYTNAHKLPGSQYSARAIANGTKYYWAPDCGTSMSSPYVAGVVALWLQAYPELNSAQALEIMQATADTDHGDMENLRWGAGPINAMEGLKQVIAQSSICAPSAQPFAIAGADGKIEIVGADPADVYIYNMCGVRFSPSSVLPAGVYVVKFQSYSQKIIVK